MRNALVGEPPSSISVPDGGAAPVTAWSARTGEGGREMGGGGGTQSVGSTAGGAGFVWYAISIEPGRVAPARPSDVVASGQVAV